MSSPTSDSRLVLPRATLDAIRATLLVWYTHQQRDLPWRNISDPYATWVSEIMLQQTRVEAVRPYFERWMLRFPTVEKLAAAELDDVLHAWQGLGYYSRARNLHRGAKQVIDNFEGRVPRSVDDLRSITGIGVYTAGAIASIAWGDAAPLVDGNVERVLARLFELDDDPRSSAGQRKRWAIAGELVRGERPGDWNQALMELGSTVCIPRGARCDRCVLAPWCSALANNRVGELPRPPIKKKSPVLGYWAVCIRDEAGRLLVGQRVAGGLLGGLWEAPLVAATSDPAADWARVTGHTLGPTAMLPAIEHIFSHRVWQITPVLANPSAEMPTHLPDYTQLRWVEPAEIANLACSRIATRVLEALAAESTQATL